MKHTHRRPRGFTLVELMIGVAVLAILSGVALPSYLSQVQKARRADARSALTAAAQAMERWYSERSTYAGASLGTTGVYPSTSANGFYTLSIVSQTAAGFSLQASPAGAQLADACGSFSYDQAGAKSVSGGTLSVAACW